MAKIVKFKDNILSVGDSVYNLTTQPISLKRNNPIPIEHYEIFNTVADAENYASSNPVAYVGQQIVVVKEDGTSVQAYIIGSGPDENGSWLIPLSQGGNMSDIEITVWEDWVDK